MKKIFTIVLVAISLQASAQCWKTVSKGFLFGAAIKNDGTLWVWGDNNQGQLGDGTTINSLIPKQVGTDNDWEMVATGNQTTIALKSNGTLWAWGTNTTGQLGLGIPWGNNVYVTTPTQIGTDTNWQTISAGYSHCKALKTDGTLWAWGSVVGNGIAGTAGYSTVPVQIGTSTWLKIATGSNHTLAIKSDGTLWGWGSNGDGQVGNNTSGNQILSPVQIAPAYSDWQYIACGEKHSMALRPVPGIYLWGRNDYGEISMANIATDVLVPSLQYTTSTWLSVSGGDGHTLAIKSDNTLWSWGSNSYGQLARPVANPSAIGQVGTDLWKEAKAGYLLNFAIKSDDSLWSCGYQGTSGRLGLGTITQAYFSLQAIGCPTSALGNNDFVNSNKESSAYPNPVRNVLNLSFDKEISSVSMYNLLGQEVLTKVINATEGAIDTSSLVKGTYMVKVSSNDGVKTLKVIKD